MSSPTTSVSSLPNSPSLGPGWTRRRPASFTPRTRPLTNGASISSTLSSPSPSSTRLSVADQTQARGRSARAVRQHPMVTACPRPLTAGALRLSEAPRHLAGKVPPTRPTLAPISTTDRCTRRSLDLGFLSAPMGENRGCLTGWESVRSLTSIGESEAPTSRSGPSRSFHFPYSGDHNPLALERRKTSDWTGGAEGEVASGDGSSAGTATRVPDNANEGWLEWGRKRLTSVTSLQMMGSGTSTMASHGGSHRQNSLSCSVNSLTPAMAALTRAHAQPIPTPSHRPGEEAAETGEFNSKAQEDPQDTRSLKSRASGSSFMIRPTRTGSISGWTVSGDYSKASEHRREMSSSSSTVSAPVTIGLRVRPKSVLGISGLLAAHQTT